jgi:FkbH-like protein
VQHAPIADEAYLRDMVLSRLHAGDYDASIQYARLLCQTKPGARTLRFLRDVAEGADNLRPFRVVLLSSFSIEFVNDALVAHGFLNGIRIEVLNSGFAIFRQQFLDPASRLYESKGDLVILAVEGEDWVPAAYDRLAGAQEDAVELERRYASELSGLLTQFRRNSDTPLVIHNFTSPRTVEFGILDINRADSKSRLVNRLNDSLYEVCSRFSDVVVLDYAGLVSRHGSRNWYDARMRLYARAPIAQPMLGELAREYVKYCRALSGLARKCLVVDLDNTLWGGVVGEEGVEGIQLGPDYPGSAFVEFQRVIKALRDRGVLLAIASKNNPQEVDEVFETHRFMVLKRSDFATVEIHWESKDESLRRIARNLNIGLDQIVFADDNAAECERIRSALPMVTVIQLPAQPERYSEVLYQDGWFDTLSFSGEDKRRGALYEQRARAEALRATQPDVESYYRDLQMSLIFSPVNDASVARAAQMTQKTNQFNATTRRYSDAEIARRAKDPTWMLTTVSVIDRFGDNGIVGFMMSRVEAQCLDIDTFLLSCRVIERTVETAMLAYLCDAARQRGLRCVRGTVIATKKNTPVRGVFARHGFDKEADDGSTSQWRLSTDDKSVPWPAWFTVVAERSLLPV